MGIYKIFTPAILIIDSEIVKEVLIKDFPSFGNNTIKFNSDGLLLSRNPFVLQFNEWKPARQLTTSLLSTSKVLLTILHCDIVTCVVLVKNNSRYFK